MPHFHLQSFMTMLNSTMRRKCTIFIRIAKSTAITQYNEQSTTGDAIIHISNQCDRVGTITNCNSAAIRMLGTEKLHIVGKEIEQFMPSFYSKSHKAAVSNYIPSEENLSKHLLFNGFVIHSSGFIIPVTVKMVEFP